MDEASPKTKPKRKRITPVHRKDGLRSEIMKQVYALNDGLRRHMEERKKDPYKMWSRRGVFDGYNREQSKQIWAEAQEQAKGIVQKMIDKGIVEDFDMSTDEAKGKYALEQAVAIIKTPANQTNKLQAIRTVLEWCKEKPTSKSKVTVQSAEEWLATITADDDA